MRRTFLALSLVALLAGACGAPSAELDDCGDVADASIDLLQDVIDELEALPPEQQEDLITDGEFPAGAELEARREVLNDRADELDCVNLKTLITERAPRLIDDTASAIGQFITDGVQAGEDMLARTFGDE